MTFRCIIGRGELALPALDLGAAPYVAYALDRPGRVWDRTMVTSPYVHGETMIGRRLAAVVVGFRVHVLAATGVELHDAVTALEDALCQLRYTVEVGRGGVLETWTAAGPGDLVPAADDGEAGYLSADWGDRHRASWLVTVPVNPVPRIVAGA